MSKINCSHCKHFKPKDITYGVKIGICSNCTSTSRPYAGDFVFTKDGPLKVCGNFGCIRFEPIPKKINYNKVFLVFVLIPIFAYMLYAGYIALTR